MYVVYGDVGANQTPDVYAVTLDRALKPVSRAQVNPVEKKKTQQFLPAAALDPTTGVLWACWYDTTFDPNAHRAWFTCSASHDGRTWSAPLRASSEPTSPNILYGTLGGIGPLCGGRGPAGRRPCVLGRRPRDRELGRHLHRRNPRKDRVLTRELTFLTLRG